MEVTRIQRVRDELGNTGLSVVVCASWVGDAYSITCSKECTQWPRIPANLSKPAGSTSFALSYPSRCPKRVTLIYTACRGHRSVGPTGDTVTFDSPEQTVSTVTHLKLLHTSFPRGEILTCGVV